MFLQMFLQKFHHVVFRCVSVGDVPTSQCDECHTCWGCVCVYGRYYWCWLTPVLAVVSRLKLRALWLGAIESLAT